jgi:hypothetical protein
MPELRARTYTLYEMFTSRGASAATVQYKVSQYGETHRSQCIAHQSVHVLYKRNTGLKHRASQEGFSRFGVPYRKA